MNELLKNLLDGLQHIDLHVCHIDTRYTPTYLLTTGDDRLTEFRGSWPVQSLLQFEPLPLQQYIILALDTDNIIDV